MWSGVVRAWRTASRVAMVAMGVCVTASATLVATGRISAYCAAVGCIQALYFFCASPLMLREDCRDLRYAALLGASAGIGAVIVVLPDSPVQGHVVGDVFRVIAAACLVVPAFFLARQVRAAADSPEADPAAGPQRRDVAAFGIYGTAFGCLILWVPVANPSVKASILSLVVVAGLSLAEVAVTWAMQRADRLLSTPYDADAFAHMSRRIIIGGMAAYLIPVGLAVCGLAILLADRSMPEPALVLASIAVLGVGAVQILSLMAMSLHGIRQVSVAISGCVGILLLATPVTEGSTARFGLYLGALTLLGASLMVVVMRRAALPINYV